MPLLAVKLDSLTWLREGKRSRDPDPAQAAVLAELGGADAITVTLHPSRRFIRDRDVYVLKEVVKTRLIVEMPLDDDLMTVALEVRPWMVTFIAENQVDPSGKEPLDYQDFEAISEASERLRGAGVVCAHHILPDAESVKNAARCRADFVEFSTSGYSRASSVAEAEAELDDIARNCTSAHKLGLGIYCGSGLTYKNVAQCAEIDIVQQVTVGRSLINRAVIVGIEQAVSQMRREIDRKI
ncbi:pyridoxine 5'-phosphate synthase [bacterium AH-315-J21]|nr:pyridoxine 5'-phosphate synthase [bacterium AH-315-J21]